MEKLQLMTPCYILDEERFSENLQMVMSCFQQQWSKAITLGYSVKTNHEPFFLETARVKGMYAEVVSKDESNHAQNCGFAPDRIILNGPGKTEDDLLYILKSGGIVNLDDLDEVRLVCAKISNLPAGGYRVGLRVNFDLERLCPGETTAGEEVSRFGICYENGDLQEAVRLLHGKGIPVAGLHLHYSSKTRSEKIFHALAQTACDILRSFALQNEIRYIDIGGGLFLGENAEPTGKPSMPAYANAICTPLKSLLDPGRVTLILEPGASLLATSVAYLCGVVNTRAIRGTTIITTDGSLLDINPFMAKRRQPAELLYAAGPRRETAREQIVCGSTCMENDRMLYLTDEKALTRGDAVLFRCVGAYTMCFNNCFINLPPYVYQKSGDVYTLLRDRKNVDMRQI